MNNLKTASTNSSEWEIKKVEDCFIEIVNGTTIQQNEAIGVPVTRIETIQKSKFDLKRIKFVNEPSQQIIDKFKYIEGDLAFSHINSLEHVGKVAIYEGKPQLLLHGMNLLRLRPKKNVLFPKFAYYYMLSNVFRSEVKRRVGKAVNQVSLNQTNLKTIPFLLPPFNEQIKMSNYLDTIFPIVDDNISKIRKAKSIISKFRQAILTSAVTGKLTESWRERKLLNIDDYILELRQQLKNNNRKRFEIDEHELDDLLITTKDLPDCWKFEKLGNVSVVQGGIQKTPQRTPASNAYPYLRVANVYRGFLKLDQIEKFEISNDELEKLRLKKGDLLIVEGNGSSDQIGRCAIWNDEIKDCVHQNHIIRSRPLEKVANEYLLYYLNSPLGIDTMVRISSSTSGLNTLSVNKINNIVIPLPTFEEQVEIVKRVNSYFDIANQVEKQIEKAEAKASKLTQAILAKTFRAEL